MPPGEATRPCNMRPVLPACSGFYLRQVRLGARVWDKLTAWALDRVLDGYPPSIDGVLGVLALDCRRVQFDFTRNEFGCSP